jgi:glyoxylase-like metal-dependent hydrolase (beta-lactamase superfamily II)
MRLRTRVLLLVGAVLLAFGLYAAYNQRDDHRCYGDTTVRTFNLGLANVHLLGRAGQYVLVDAGPAGQEAELEARLRRAGVRPAAIRLIILSHGHADHAGGARYFQRRYGIPVLAGAGDTAMLRRGRNDSLTTHSALGRFTRRFIATRATDWFPALRPDLMVVDSFSLRPYGLAGTVRALPGHTPGSVLVALGRVAFVGDLFRGALLARQVPREHFFQPDLAVAHRTIRQVLQQPFATFYLGHGGPCRAEDVRWELLPE